MADTRITAPSGAREPVTNLPPAAAPPSPATSAPGTAEPRDPTTNQSTVHLAAEGMRVVLWPIPGLTQDGLLPLNGFVFQCPPLEEFTVNYAHGHSDYETLESQQSRAGVPQLATIQFQTLAVDEAIFVVNPDVEDIDDITNKLRDICLSGTPFLLSATHHPHPNPTKGDRAEFQDPATLRSFSVTEKAGEGDARYYNVSFTEYRAAKQARKKAGKGASNTPPTSVKLYWDGRATDAAGNRLADPPEKPITLAYLSRKFYKNAKYAQRIGQHNKLGNWGATDPLVKHPRWSKLKKGKFAKVKLPKKASLPRPEDD